MPCFFPQGTLSMSGMGLSLEEILDSHRTRRPVIMGVVNVTPDSFSDGGRFFKPQAAVRHARELLEQGADILDVGAESTRPGSDGVPAGEQIARLRDVLPALAACGAVVSIDTTLSDVAAFALEAGAQIVNDVSAGRDDPELLALAARRRCGLVLMHMLGRARTMQQNPQYRDVVGEVRDFLAERLAAARAAGVPEDRCIVDPGIGFGKTLEHNLALLAGTGKLLALGRPILVGPSRKRFIGQLTGQDQADRRAAGTVAACLAAWRRGATVFRVHDVADLKAALAVEQAIEEAAGRFGLGLGQGGG